VFAGGFVGASASSVCGAGRRTLASLVGASLLGERVDAGGSMRWFMLETVREYALELLEELGEGERYRDRHAAHYAELAEAVEDEHPASGSGAAWRRLESEQDNFRAALDFLRVSGAVELELRLVGALAYFWATSDNLREGENSDRRRAAACGRTRAAAREGARRRSARRTQPR
jgi:predicted ATPase